MTLAACWLLCKPLQVHTTCTTNRDESREWVARGAEFARIVSG